MIGNGCVGALLRSPLRGLIDDSTLLISLTGRRSGKTITTPVNYLRVGDGLRILSMRHRIWWRNCRGGAEIGLYLRGRPMRATATLVESPEAVCAELAEMLGVAPHLGRWLGLPAGAAADAAALARIAQERVVVRCASVRPA